MGQHLGTCSISLDLAGGSHSDGSTGRRQSSGLELAQIASGVGVKLDPDRVRLPGAIQCSGAYQTKVESAGASIWRNSNPPAEAIPRGINGGGSA